MKKVLILLLISLSTLLSAQNYSKYFTNDRLRLDLYHFGTDKTDNYSIKSFIKETPWSGPKKNLEILPSNGTYILKVKDGEQLIFQTAYNTLFEEWQDTQEATTRTRIFEESLFIPYPKTSVNIEIFAHADDLSLQKIWETTFNPDSTWVEKLSKQNKSELIHGSTDYENAIDIAIIAEGYTLDEMQKFKQDAERKVKFFLAAKPFNQYKDKFNFYIVMSPSQESGTDQPGKDIWKETVIDSHFYSFGVERYLTTNSFHKCMDLISDIPHDQVVIMVNTPKYGGGGILNYYTLITSDHSLSDIVFTHEFGHSFGGLADEYFTPSSTAFVKYPDLKYELLEPNVTNLVDFDSKWKSMLGKDTPIPTPDTEAYENTIGVFEGGRYIEKGIYRPVRNCRMRNNTSEFCPVCTSVLVKLIRFYSGMETKE